MDYSILSSTRKRMGLSQVKLASLSGVSLPSIQNIEAGRGNPSADTLEKLLKTLGLRLVFQEIAADWAILILCGLPLTLTEDESARLKGLRPTRELLLEHLSIGLSRSTELREKEAMAALLLAMRDHFPTVYQDFNERIQGYTTFVSKILSDRKNHGRLIKLRRIALARLAEYL